MSLLLLIGGATSANTAPIITVTSPQNAFTNVASGLGASVIDDGLPSGTLTHLWTFVSGPGGVTFTDATDPATNAVFDTVGVYVINLTSSDSVLSDSENVTVNVSDPPTSGGDHWIKWLNCIWH